MHPFGARGENLKTKMVVLKSSDAEFNSDFDFSFTLKETMKNINTVQLISASVPYCFPNINSYNSTLFFTDIVPGMPEDITQHSITITSGVYDIANLCTALKTAMDTASNGDNVFTIALNEITKKLSITGAREFTIDYTKTTIKDIIGMNASLSSVSKVATMQETVDLMPSKQIEIHLPTLLNNQSILKRNTAPINDDIIMILPLDSASPYSYISNPFTSEELQTNTTLNEIVVSITDQTGFTPSSWDSNKYGFTLFLKFTYFR